MEGPRPPLEHEVPQVIRFLNDNLRKDSGWSISQEYPLAFQEMNHGNIRVITEDSRILAHAVMRPMVVKTAAGLFRIAAIGSVVTSETHRNQGLSTRTLESCLEAAKATGCDFAILWTNLYDFYRRLGFELAGSEISLTLHPNGAAPLRELQVSGPRLKLLESAQVAPEAILRLYSQHTVGTVRTAEDIRRHLTIPNARVYTAWSEEGHLRAYAIEGKGEDLSGYIHEWGGGVSALTWLVQEIVRKQARPITLIGPATAQNLHRNLLELGAKETRGFLGMIKLLQSDRLLAKVRKYAMALGHEQFVFEKKGDVFLLGGAGSTFSTDSERDVIRLIFGPQKPSQIHQFDPNTAQLLDAVLPVPMWVWGWDSV
jgi:GNAT superfamily N-acetyltransferase